jgi:NHS family xanthosine MFS transporter
MSLSQVSETVFILAIPFFLKRYGIKKVMLISMFAWVLRFGLLAFGNPADGLWMIIVSCIVYGMAFDFFNISGSLFVETNTAPSMRSSAQGLFMMMTNGIGAMLGSYSSGIIIENYYKLKFETLGELTAYFGLNSSIKADSAILERMIGSSKIVNGQFTEAVSFNNWPWIWITFALYALVIAVLFALLFRHKHDPEMLGQVNH